jgi:signal transduction histidine kinase/CheY-like chemotaxis protein/cytosine/uracil/thiamine/allantoin permease
MTGRQRIARVRRQYNQWVGNQTLEDYALRFTAHGARRWSAFRVANTALGAISFLACEAIGGSLTLDYGFTNAISAIVAVGVLIFLTGLPIGYYATRYGVDIDLLTRGAGFGYIGSTVTSLIYASFTFLLFSVEAVIMSLALEMCFGIPLALGYVICALVVIPIVIYGIRFISALQLWTQPVWLVLQILPLAYIACSDHVSLRSWTSFAGHSGNGAFDLLLFGTAASTLLSFAPQIGEQVDYLRFMPSQARGGKRGRLGWWLAMLPAGPGWVVIGGAKLVAGSFLAVLALQHGVGVEHAAEPTQIYRVAFEAMSLSPRGAILVTGIFVITCQLKINVTNMYAGSIAWSNFFSRLTHSHPGRVVWLIFNVALALLLMELGVFAAIEKILGLYSNFAVAWIGALVGDLIINKPLGLSPRTIEFRRAHLYDINPVGTGAMLLAILVSTAAFFGAFGKLAQALAPFIGLAIAILAAPAIAYLTKGRYYIARPAILPTTAAGGIAKQLTCCICEHAFEREDMSHCPAYDGPICSLCCSLDARCHDLCKTNSRFTEQLHLLLGRLLPDQVAQGLNSRLGHFAGLFLIFNLVIGGALLLIGVFQGTTGPAGDAATIHTTLFSVYFALFGISGIAAWLMVLAQESRHVAEQESDRQTQMLTREIEAHERTYDQLQKAKTAAESASIAKSRFVVGMSHEIRAPLNSIFGYAQLLERDMSLPPQRQDAVRVIRRSAEHLAALIDGLLDIARIEAGRLQLSRDRIALRELLDQIVGMFRLQADAKGIDFFHDYAANLPQVVHGDEKRLRQILINLLSNAIKYTPSGHAALHVHYRGQVCYIEVSDSGIGIAPTDLARIFEPFERGSSAGAQMAPGTGLGLTITKLLTEIMGGEISVESAPGGGSTFRVRLALSAVTEPAAERIESRPVPERRISGYHGRRHSIVAADDDSGHLELLRDILIPLGFDLHVVSDGLSCLQLVQEVRPDLLILDLSMPGLGGWQVAQRLREAGLRELPILIASANVDEQRPGRRSADMHGHEPPIDHDDFIVKPIALPDFLGKLQTLLRLTWSFDEADAAWPAPDDTAGRSPAPQAATRLQEQAGARSAMPPEMAAASLPERHHLDDLHQLGLIGYVRGIDAKLDELAASHADFAAGLRRLIREFDLTQYMAVLEAYRDNRA